MAFLLLMQIVSAVDTEIKIKTLPDHEVQLTTFKSNTADFIIIESFKEDSDEYGDITFATSTNDPQFNIVVYIKKDNVKIMGPEKFLDNPSGEPIYLEIAPNWFTFIDTPTNETNTTEETIENLTLTDIESDKPQETISDETEQDAQDQGLGLTGSAISEDGFASKKSIYYAAGIIGLLIISFIMFIAVRKTKSTRKRKGMEKLDQALDKMDSKGKKPKNKRDILQDVKSKMQEVEREIDELKE